MLRAVATCCAAAAFAAPAAGAALGARHEGSLSSVLTVSPPPSAARTHPMRWSRWGGAPRTLTAASLHAFGGRAIVGLRSPRDLASVARDYGLTAVQPLAALHAALVGASTPALRALLTRGHGDARIRYVEQDGTLAPAHARNDPLTTTVNPDTNLPYEWQFAATRVDLALNLTHGSSTILVGDVDTGVGDVPDLQGKIAERWYSSTYTSAIDSAGHGTAVASLIAANRDDGYGIAGFGGDARVAAYKTDFSVADIALGVTTLVGRGVRILNLSLGASQPSSLITDALNAAQSRGVLVVASTGNDGMTSVSYPAATLQPPGGGPSAGLAVGASSAVGTPSFFSNIGVNLSLLAPGNLTNSAACSGVLAPISTPASDWDASCFQIYVGKDGARYAEVAGTSFAAPEVAGVAALVWAAKPSLRNDEVAQIIKDSASRPANSGWNTTYGWGVLDAARALEEATGQSSADRVVVTPSAPSETATQLTETAAVAWSDGVTIAAGDASCSATVGRKTLEAVSSTFAGGVATCVFGLPAALSGEVQGHIGATDTTSGLAGSAPFEVTLADTTPPTIRAVASTGRRGAAVPLRFVAADGSGTVAVHVVVSRGSTTVFSATTAFLPTSARTLSWHAPLTAPAGGLRFCLTAKDRAGNVSPRSCAAVGLR